MQMQAGAVGIACATVAEAAALSESGITGLLITSPVAGAAKIERIAELNREKELAVVVDHIHQVDGIISVPAGATCPDLGDRLLIGATHCDPTVNLHSAFHVVRNDGVEEWATFGRY